MTESDSPAKPVFMFGLDRSGTTLLSMMVGAHPGIAVPLSATGMWYDVADKQVVDVAKASETSAIVDYMLDHERIRLWDQSLDRDAILEMVVPGDFGTVIAAFHREYARQCGKAGWASMDIATLDNMHLINQWFPNARFVHLVRDGRDVALSHQAYKYGFGNIVECAEKWTARVTCNLRMGAMIDPDRYFVLHYENLILEPEASLRRLCKFIGVGYSDQMLDYGKAVECKVPKEKLFLWPSLKEPPKASKVGRWRNEMKPSERILFEQRAGVLLRELGYETYDTPPRSVAAMLLELWYCLGQGQRFKRLRRRLFGG